MTFIGESPTAHLVRERIARLLQQLGRAHRPPTVLLQGETGTGKGLVAAHLHRHGPRARGPFVDLNCAAIPDTLLEAELFGFEQGAFTDARRAKPGLFQAAEGGTLFLDEVGLLPLPLQAKLLKVLEERSVRRLGSTRSTPVDVWTIAATNEDLAAAVSTGRIREDFFHRIGGFILPLPPLRDRREDIPLLAEHFLHLCCRDYGLPPKRLSVATLDALQAYPWPGNVRELANVVERAVLLADAEELLPGSLDLPRSEAHESHTSSTTSDPALRFEVDRFERERLLAALEDTHWNISFAADRLKIPRNTLRYRMARYGLRPASAPPRRPKRSLGRRALHSVERATRRQIALLFVSLYRDAGAPPSSTSKLRELAVEKIQSFGGGIDGYDPDGILGVFGLEPREDAARLAAHAALTMRTAAARIAGTVDVGVLALHSMRVSVEQATGVCRLAAASRHAGRTELARLIASSSASGIVASTAIAPLLERWFELEPLPGDSPIPPFSSYRVVGSRLRRTIDVSTRRRSQFVGRDRELIWLQDLASRSAGGTGSVIGIVGDPGAGKSRLLREFAGLLERQSIRYLEGCCLSHCTSVPYSPMLNLLRREWQLEDLDDQTALGERIRHHLERTEVPADDVPYFLRLFGVTPDTNAAAALTPEDVRERTFAALRRLLLASTGPVVLAMEDLHWVDKTSEEFLASFAESVPAAPVLFVATYRPGYRPPWIERSYVSQLALPPLSPSESRAVIDAFLEADRIGSADSDSLIERGDGNPFFLEELALAASHQHGLDAGTVPATVHEVLDARIDRLPEPLQRVLDTAAVLGRESSILLLERMLQRPSWLPAALKELVGLEFLHERSATRLYSFRHALIREAILERLSPSDRKTLHERAAHALEDMYATRLDEVTDQLSFHYSQTDVDSKAIEYLMRFGDRAIANHSLSEGVMAFEEALAKAWQQAQDGHAIALALTIRLAFPLLLLGRPEAARDALLRCRKYVETCGSSQQRGEFYLRLGVAYDHLGDYQNGIPFARLAIREGTQAEDRGTVAKAQIILMHANWFAGDYKAGLANAEIAATAFRTARDPLWQGMARWTEAWLHIHLGDFDAAAAARTDIVAAASQLGSRRLETNGHALAGWISIRRGKLTEGIEACQHALLCAPDPLAKAIVLTILGEGQTRAGDLQGALANLTAAHAMFHQFPMLHSESWAAGHLVDVHIKLGEVEVARDLALKLESYSKASGFRLLEGLARRGLGRAELSRGSADVAESHLRYAADRFVSLGARYDLANTYLDLAATAALKNDAHLKGQYLLKARRLFRVMNALAPIADPSLC